MKKNLAKSQKVKSDKKTFLEHLAELRNRFFVWLLFLILFSVIGYIVYPTILSLLTEPLGKPLYYTSPAGGLETVFNTSLFFGFIASLPILLYQFIKFIRPSFGKGTSLPLFGLVLSSLLLAGIGIAVCYYLVLPPCLRFLGEFGGDDLTPLISSCDYFSFVIKYLVSFAVIFQMPLVMLAINKLKPLSIKKLLINFRYVFLFSFIASAVLTPTPDLLNQAIMATPILLLYLTSVFVIWIINRHNIPLASTKKIGV